MSVRRTVHRPAWILGIGLALCAPEAARAQANVGTGPLTTQLTDTEPTSGAINLGVVTFAPGITVREIGWDSNVFDEPPEQSPKEDWVASVQPDISAFTQMRLIRISAYAGGDFTYYRTYDSERSSGYSLRGRIDLLLSRLRPFVGAGDIKTRERPNGEIDVRADRREDELGGGLAFDLSDYSLLYGSTYKYSTRYEDAFEDGVDLGQTLTRDAYNYQLGLRTDITPLLGLQLFGSYQEDRFVYEPLRDSETVALTASFDFSPDAVVSGAASVSFRDMTFVDPLVSPYRGLTGSAVLTYPLLELGRFNILFSRGVEYSFDIDRAYYLEHTFGLSYTHRLFGEVDVQARGGRSTFDYEARAGTPEHIDTLDLWGGSLGYNLRNRTRIALNYEYSRRRSPIDAERNYERRRVFLSWQFAV